MNKFILVVLAFVLIASMAFKVRKQTGPSHSPAELAALYSSYTAGALDDLVDEATALANQELEAAGVEAPTQEQFDAAYEEAVAELTAASSDVSSQVSSKTSSAPAGHR